MSLRPRRSAATRASIAIADIAMSRYRSRSATPTSTASSPRRTTRSGASRGTPPSVDGDESLSTNARITRSQTRRNQAMPPTKLRQAGAPGSQAAASSRRDQFEGGEILDGKRSRTIKQSYVVQDSDDDEEEEPKYDNGGDSQEDDDDDDVNDDDDDMDDAEGEDDDDDAEGEDNDDMDVDLIETPQHAPPAIKITKPKTAPSPAKAKATARSSARFVIEEDDDDDDELSDPDSDMQDDDEEGDEEEEEEEEAEEDAEGEEDDEVEVDDEPVGVITPMADADEDAEGEPDSDDDLSRLGTPDLSKMTRRQRARFEDSPQQYMKLSDEVQVKKHLTAEELSMRRAEMARRRRNLSDKRNEEVKMETINKLLKKQAPKGKGKAVLGTQNGEDQTDPDGRKPHAAFVRWINSREGSRIGVPGEMLAGPVGVVFGGPSGGGLAVLGRLIEEVP